MTKLKNIADIKKIPGGGIEISLHPLPEGATEEDYNARFSEFMEGIRSSEKEFLDHLGIQLDGGLDDTEPTIVSK